MTFSSSRLLEENPDRIANQLIQKAHNRDGLPEIAIGLTFLLVALTMWMQIAYQPGSLTYKIAPLILGLLVPALILSSQWAIKKVRTQFLIGKTGYVKSKPVNRKAAGMVVAIAFVIAVAAVIAAYLGRNSSPPTAWFLAGTGIGGGLLLILAGRLPRFVVGGVIMSATGVALAVGGVSLGTGFMILYGIIGLLSLISGCVVLVLFLRQPTEPAQ